MPKPEFLTPKAISNRIKARGLQKLRWYCQLCQKQCRDENGFKCHQTSASHRRQMELFGQSPGQIVAQYSRQFEGDFMEHMRVCHPNSRVSANRVYNEFIKDKDHIHMNSTRWLSLSGFVQYLAKKGLCKIEQTAKGWFIQLVPKDDETDLRRAKRRERETAEKLDDVRQMKEIDMQIKKASEHVEESLADPSPTELRRKETDTPISFTVQKEIASRGKEKEIDEKETKRQKLHLFGEEPPSSPPPSSFKGQSCRKGMSHLELIHAGIKGKRQKESASWLKSGIVVKVMSPSLRIHGYYKQKGVVKKLIASYIAEIEMISSRDIVHVDQAELETVLPAMGGKLLILKGPQEECIAEMTGIDIEKFSVEVKLLKGPEKGQKKWYEYEEVSKLYNQQLCS